MKKKILTLGFSMAMFFLAAKVADACTYYVLSCAGGGHHYVYVCDDSDYQAWRELLCGETFD